MALPDKCGIVDPSAPGPGCEDPATKKCSDRFSVWHSGNSLISAKNPVCLVRDHTRAAFELSDFDTRVDHIQPATH